VETIVLESEAKLQMIGTVLDLFETCLHFGWMSESRTTQFRLTVDCCLDQLQLQRYNCEELRGRWQFLCPREHQRQTVIADENPAVPNRAKYGAIHCLVRDML
ncbi:hypothetical protein H4R33_006885, partial [Dimargaris cristalligena]